MAPFALPLPKHYLETHSERPHSTILKTTRTTIKRKRASSPASLPPNDTNSSSPAPSNEDEHSQSSQIPAALTNPLALTPAEIEQYRLAGLPLDEELPSVREPGFPYRRLKSQKSTEKKVRRRSRSARASVPATKQVRQTNPIKSLKVQHIEVLTTLMMRCLQEGDVERASRAWALLLRINIGGVAIELKESGYWGVGAELLIRSGESRRFGSLRNDTGEPQDEVEDYHGESNGMITRKPTTGVQKSTRSGARRLGTESGLDKAREYYERLILQFPYRRQYPNSIDALDFWPAMIGCEIYGIQMKYEAALSALEAAKENDGIIFGNEYAFGDYGLPQAGESYEEAQERVDKARRRERDEELRKEKERIRREAMKAAEHLAVRMDELMGPHPFSDAVNLLRLRGMIALFIGDLHVVNLRGGHGDEEEGELTESLESRSQMERGLGFKRTEYRKAKRCFDKVRDQGGEGAVGEMPELDHLGMENNGLSL